MSRMKLGVRGSFGKKRVNSVNKINVTPLVDVMLVLLIIFMITSPMLLSGLDVDLPETASSSTLNIQEEPISISIDQYANIYIGESKIESQDLTEKLVAISNGKMDKRIYVRGDQKISYGQIMEIIGRINASGFSQVSLVTNVNSHENKKSK